MVDERLLVIVYVSIALFIVAVGLTVAAGIGLGVAVAWNMLLAFDIEYFKLPIGVAETPLLILANIIDVIVFAMLAVWIASIFFDFIKGLGLKERYMKAKVRRLKGHAIVAPYNGFSTTLYKGLAEKGIPTVFIVKNKNELDRVIELGAFGIIGNLDSKEVLHNAGIEAASYAIACSDDDISNGLMAVSAKSANHAIKLITRVAHQENIPKLNRSGVYKCIMPEMSAGAKIAGSIINLYS